MLIDIIAKDLTVIFCGINPGLKSAADGHHFAGRGNRFWKALYLAGFTSYQIEPANDTSILDFGYGLTTAVERATSRADQLSKEEFTESFENFKSKMTTYKPKYIAFLGKVAYSLFSKKKQIPWGKQEEELCGAIVWILPNPSGLNRGFRLDDLVDSYGEFYKEINK